MDQNFGWRERLLVGQMSSVYGGHKFYTLASVPNCWVSYIGTSYI